VYGANEKIGLDGLQVTGKRRTEVGVDTSDWTVGRKLYVLVEVHIKCLVERFAASGDAGIPEWVLRSRTHTADEAIPRNG